METIHFSGLRPLATSKLIGMGSSDQDLYLVKLSTNGSPWIPQTVYAQGTIFLAYNSVRVLSIEATRAGSSGGGVNPDGSFWGTPFTQWALDNAQMRTTFVDGTTMWVVVAVAPMVAPPMAIVEPRNAGVDGFVQNPSVGGTPVSFLNFIDPTPWEPLIHRHWDLFDDYWRETLRYTTRLYAVEIVFNAKILLAGQGEVMQAQGSIPQFSPFEGHVFRHIKKEIGEIADSFGIMPVTVTNARLQLPNLVYIVNPHLPKPGQRGQRERGGAFSNL